MSEGYWIDLANGVHARRYAELDLTVGLVTGNERCLVIDTRGDVEQGSELANAIRARTVLPWIVVYTHAHFDHCFGTEAFLPCDIWAHQGCSSELHRTGEQARAARTASYSAEGTPEIADALRRTRIVRPSRLLESRASLDLGRRMIDLIHPGPAHTDHDVIVHIRDSGIAFTGDIVENASAGFSVDSFGWDNDLANWPNALNQVLALNARTVVPGHGDPVSAEYVATQREQLATLASVAGEFDAGTCTKEQALFRSPYPEDVTNAALNRSVS